MMTAVEVLEWLRENYYHHNIMIDVFGADYGYTELIGAFTPQEIVDRIEQHEAEKNLKEFDEESCKSNCRISAISDSDCADHCDMKCPHIHTADADKKVEQEFKVGDWVKVSLNGLTGYGILEQIRDGGEYYVKTDKHYGWFVKEIEHAEPPKEELQYDDYDNGCDVCFYANKMCEEYPCNSCKHGSKSDIEHFTLGKPKEEKQKIEKLENEYRVTEIIKTINQLVDAVNELRGV